jgi:translation elongation factor EF-Ts
VGILNLPTFGPQFLEEVKNVWRRSIFKSLFSNGLLAKEALCCGFMKYLESMQHSTNISNIMKRQIMKTMDKFVEEPKLIDLVFVVDINVDVEDFLNSCTL